MSDKRLLERVSKLGFPLLETDDDIATLADVVRSKDLRLWEGFPVMLANASLRNDLDFEKLKSQLSTPADKKHLLSLVLMSCALYKALEVNISWVQTLEASLSTVQREEIRALAEKIREDIDLSIIDRTISSQRLKTSFKNYFIITSQTMLSEFLSIKDEANLEYSMSQIFSARQRDLVFKKLKGEKLTKTEKEYFSRVVKKKLSALANPDLHRLAQRVFQ